MSRENIFYIDFDTEDGPGLLAVRVTLDSEYIQDMNKKLNIALADHPLYWKLERYVLANPSGRSGE